MFLETLIVGIVSMIAIGAVIEDGAAFVGAAQL